MLTSPLFGRDYLFKRLSHNLVSYSIYYSTLFSYNLKVTFPLQKKRVYAEPFPQSLSLVSLSASPPASSMVVRINLSINYTPFTTSPHSHLQPPHFGRTACIPPLLPVAPPHCPSSSPLLFLVLHSPPRVLEYIFSRAARNYPISFAAYSKLCLVLCQVRDSLSELFVFFSYSVSPSSVLEIGRRLRHSPSRRPFDGLSVAESLSRLYSLSHTVSLCSPPLSVFILTSPVTSVRLFGSGPSRAAPCSRTLARDIGGTRRSAGRDFFAILRTLATHTFALPRSCSDFRRLSFILFHSTFLGKERPAALLFFLHLARTITWSPRALSSYRLWLCPFFRRYSRRLVLPAQYRCGFVRDLPSVSVGAHTHPPCWTAFYLETFDS